MNKVIIKGRLTHDPELKTTQNGIEYCDFSVAVSRYAGKDKEPETDFIPCKAWRQGAAFINKYFTKGKEILVEGSMRFDRYEKDGEKRTYAYVTADRTEFCGGKAEGNAGRGGQAAEFSETLDDNDLPF